MPKKSTALRYFEAVGRRKSAVARVRLFDLKKGQITTVLGGKIKLGDIFVNKKPIEVIYSSEVDKEKYLFPLKVSKTDGRFAISIIVRGGGKKGQLEAIVHGLSRAIEKIDKNLFRPGLKKEGLLSRDSRVKQRRQVGTGGKARRKKQSPKR